MSSTMNTNFTEGHYEDAIMELLGNLGYNQKNGREMSRDETDPLYESALEESLRRLNPDLPEEAIKEALTKVRHFDNADLIDQNALFMNYLQNGVEVHYWENGVKRDAICYLVDYDNPENNEFTAIRQWTVIENHRRVPDLVLFLNGLPVVLMELKSPSREETGASDAYLQIRNYLQDIPSIFIYNAICVMSDLALSKAGTITSGEDRFMEWKTKDGRTENLDRADFVTFFEGMFAKQRLLDLIKNFICFSDEGLKKAKILAGYHQYFAVRKAVESTLRGVESDGRGGVFWHTQGSGKSLSMVFYAHLLHQKLSSPTIVVLTDRNDLDQQLFTQFLKCRAFLRQTPVEAESREHLKSLLDGVRANGIFFTTIQKFVEEETPLSERKNIVVMVDEAHRGQYGLTEQIKFTRGKDGEESARRVVGMALKVRKCLPNATFIGFTGTPISRNDRCTQAVFSDYIDIYDMTQVVKDGATRPVYYESRGMKLHLDEETLRLLDAEYDLMAENADPAVVEKSKRQLGQMEAILGNEKTIRSLVDDILRHYESTRADLLTGKALIVAYSRPIAMKIYKQILERRPDWTNKVKVVMTSSNQDPEEWKAIIGNKPYRNQLAAEFKDNDSEFKIAIVVDMWLTGFDVPSLATMYVYKPMKGHNLMQAIARVNRVYGDKEGGLIVDYVGLAQALKMAMRDYTKRDNENYGDVDITRTAYPKFLEKLEVCRDLFHGFDYSNLFDGSNLQRAKTIRGAVNFIIDPKRGCEDVFVKEAKLLYRALTLCASIVEENQRFEASFFEAVRVLVVRLKNAGGDRKISLKEMNERINELLKGCVKSEGMINLFSDISKEFSLFDPLFLAKISQMKEKNLAVEILKKLLTEQVSAYGRTNLVKSKKFSEILKAKLNQYINGLLTNEEVIEELKKLAEEMAAARKEGEDLGLTETEVAFYDALSKPEAVKDYYENDELVALTRELTEKLRKNKTIDWHQRESARAEMRMIVKRLLRKYDYPPKGAEEALKTVIEQCEHWVDNPENYEE